MKVTTNKFISQKEESLNFVRLLVTACLPLMKIVLTTLVKSILVPLGLTAAASTTNATIQKNVFGSGITALIISNEKMEDIVNVVKFLVESGLVIKGVSETIKNEAKEQKGGYLGMSLGTLGESLLGSVSAGKGAMRAGDGVIWVGEGQEF